ncbi:MAG: metallophosphoesterase, partial [Bacteroidota bacterium]
GLNTRDQTGTVYVVSVSGGKMYQLREGWEYLGAQHDRAAENTQLFQVIDVNADTLTYQAYTATGELYDAFDLIKSSDGGPNRFVERQQEAIAARRHDNTIAYEDELPQDVEAMVMNRYEGYELDGVRYVQEGDFTGYQVELEKGESEVNLKINSEGEIVEEVMEN